MNEILPGIFHWTARHERIGIDVSSYYVTGSRTLIDPMLPAEGIAWFRAGAAPERIVLTNRHHYRHSAAFVEEFGCRVLCHEAGLHEFEDGPTVEGGQTVEGGLAVEAFRFGDELAPDVLALELGVICPEETVLHVAAGSGTLAFADGVVRMFGDDLGFVPDDLLGDEPEAIKQGLCDAVRPLLDHEFDSLLFAHGEPLVGGGKVALSEFADAGA